MNLTEYLQPIQKILDSPEQKDWIRTLIARTSTGGKLLLAKDHLYRDSFLNSFKDRVRTEEIKAWYSEPQGDSLFQGTSISSLTIPHILTHPLLLNSIEELEDEIATAFVAYHNRHVDKARHAILEDNEEWFSQGLFYGVVIGAKVISQAFHLEVAQEDIIFKVQDQIVDPHEITTYPTSVRVEYFERCSKHIPCLNIPDIEQNEFESSLVLADISKPRIEKYRNKIILAPIRCNEIATVMSIRIVEKIKKNSQGKINPKSFNVTIYDTDTPYTYHDIMGFKADPSYVALPGLTVLGTSGTIDAFRWLYSYRLSLISQKIQKGSIYSQVHSHFVPFVFYGVLVWRDAEILLDMNRLSYLRYRGNIDPRIELRYLVTSLIEEKKDRLDDSFWEDFAARHCLKGE